MTPTTSSPRAALVLLALGLCTVLTGTAAATGTQNGGGACSATARAARQACGHEAQDDYWIAVGNCNNRGKPGERAACLRDARDELDEGAAECGDQFDARQDVCAALGQAAYAPHYQPDDFVDPLKIGGPTVAPNPYLPLVPGTRYTYENPAEGERIVVSVLRETIEIDGVTCIVVHDVVTDKATGDTIEDTDDFLAQDLQGNVWYFGEVSREYEDGFLVSLDGSWRAGVDDAKAGILMRAAPQVGDIYRQEFLLGEAEDIAEVTSLAGSATSPYASCAGTCLVTKEYTPTEPGSFERKFYKPGLGLIRIVNPESGAREVLVKVEKF